MDYVYTEFKEKTHRLIPSRYPPVGLFDWVDSPEELEQLALLEGLSNDRLLVQNHNIHLVAREDWIFGPGSTPLMAAFTHFGPSRFSDGSTYGVYYAADTVHTAIAETRFHRERFLAASNEPPCLMQMREYTARVTRKIIDICHPDYESFTQADMHSYPLSQQFGHELKLQKEWGVLYPSARRPGAQCVAIFRPPALSLPTPAGHYDYIWNGHCISEVRKSLPINERIVA